MLRDLGYLRHACNLDILLRISTTYEIRKLITRSKVTTKPPKSMYKIAEIYCLQGVGSLQVSGMCRINGRICCFLLKVFGHRGQRYSRMLGSVNGQLFTDVSPQRICQIFKIKRKSTVFLYIFKLEYLNYTATEA